MSTTTITQPGNENGVPTNGSAVLLCEPADVYHAKAGEYLSSHLLADFRKCPPLYWQKVSGQIVDQDRPAYLVGRAAHTLILEGRERFDQDFAIGGPINPKTGEPFGSATKAFVEWQAQHGKAVLTQSQYALVQAMADSVRSHLEADELLRDGIAEGVVRTEYCDVPAQIRLDYFDPTKGIVDLKTTDDLTWFEADARRYGYAHQLAFYQAVLAKVIGLPMPVFMVAVEKRNPYRTGVWQVSDDTLRIARQENEAAIRRLLHCKAKNYWPTGYEERRVFDVT